MIKFLDLKKQYLSIKDEIDEAIAEVIDSQYFVGGPVVKRFEENFANYQNAEHAIGVGNGTDALEIAVEALNLPKGSEIIVPANTFIATSEAVTRTGHKIRFCDCGNDYTISPENLKENITPETKAVIIVHLYGNPCDMDAIWEITRNHNLVLIEDCAQAHGAEYHGKRVGTFGAIAAFSFYPGKNLGAYGDAGAIITNDAGLAEKCRKIKDNGSLVKYHHEFEGRNSRLDAIQAAVLDVKLKHLDNWIESRNHVAEIYFEELSGIPGLILPPQKFDCRHSYHLFVIRIDDKGINFEIPEEPYPNPPQGEGEKTGPPQGKDLGGVPLPGIHKFLQTQSRLFRTQRDALSEYLYKNEIQTLMHYPVALPNQPAYSYMEPNPSIKNAVLWDNQLLSLPMGEHLEDSEVREVCRVVREFYAVGNS